MTAGFDKKVICGSQHSKDLSDIFRDQLTASLQNTSKKFFSTSSEHQKEQTFEHSATMPFAIPWAFSLTGSTKDDNTHNYETKTKKNQSCLNPTVQNLISNAK